jgi:transcription elongation factor Elf1
MAPLLFTCPKTGKQTPTGIEIDAKSLRSAWSKSLKLQCPQCGKTHEIAVRETFVEFALDAAAGHWQ